MHQKIPIRITDTIAETLFIPLYMRSLETIRTDGIISDPAACTLVESLDFDFSRYDKKPMSQIGTAIRIRHFDSAARQFIESHNTPVIVNIGCGLDTRFQRIDTGKGVFVELDLPEVISLREKLLPDSKRNPSITSSMFDPKWMEDLQTTFPDADWMFIAEGVMMYFPEDKIKSFLTDLAHFFPSCQLHFDACSTWACKNSHKHETVKLTNAKFQWGLDDDLILESWINGLSHKKTNYYMNQEKKRWGLQGYIARLFMPKRANTFRMLHYELNCPTKL
jgi:O-methyltransferase involved in polyketide biosynthesis